VEAGLRSFDRSMPEEINRIVTDGLSDFLFTTEESANTNLRREGIPEEKIYFVGNTMIDTLMKHRERAQHSTILEALGLKGFDSGTTDSRIRPYGVLTLHRPSNVDGRETFLKIQKALEEVSKQVPILFPVHPRTLSRIKEFGVERGLDFMSFGKTIQPRHIYCLKPLGYLEFLCLMANARLVLTDSGGIQEETTVLGIPCITLRECTERPVTTTHGTNVIVGTDTDKIIEAGLKALNGDRPRQRIPVLWDGKAGERIVSILKGGGFSGK
jgi:UDP-N-acetylglucosamine 2-epimerase (non-hydrolysing)